MRPISSDGACHLSSPPSCRRLIPVAVMGMVIFVIGVLLIMFLGESLMPGDKWTDSHKSFDSASPAPSHAQGTTSSWSSSTTTCQQFPTPSPSSLPSSWWVYLWRAGLDLCPTHTTLAQPHTFASFHLTNACWSPTLIPKCPVTPQVLHSHFTLTPPHSPTYPHSLALTHTPSLLLLSPRPWLTLHKLLVPQTPLASASRPTVSAPQGTPPSSLEGSTCPSRLLACMVLVQGSALSSSSHLTTCLLPTWLRGPSARWVLLRAIAMCV